MADGAYRWRGQTPAPDAERTAAIREAIDLHDPELGQTYGERARREVLTLIERLLAETRAGDLGECSTLLAYVHERLAALDPRALQTARGIAGWFDSRGRRLKRFRAEFLAVMRGVTDTVADLVDRGGGLERRDAALEQLWAETRTAISELDAYIAAGQARLAEPHVRADPAPVAGSAGDDAAASEALAEPEPEAPVLETPPPIPAVADTVPAAHAPELETLMEAEPVVDARPDVAAPIAEAVPAPAGIDAMPEPPGSGTAPIPPPLSHGLEERVAALVAVRDTAVRQLPLVRVAQNADCRLPERLKTTGEAATRWRTEWSEALGLTSKRPRKIRPDQAWLARERETLAAALVAADLDIAAARARRSEVEGRMTRVAESIRRTG